MSKLCSCFLNSEVLLRAVFISSSLTLTKELHKRVNLQVFSVFLKERGNFGDVSPHHNDVAVQLVQQRLKGQKVKHQFRLYDGRSL